MLRKRGYNAERELREQAFRSCECCEKGAARPRESYKAERELQVLRRRGYNTERELQERAFRSYKCCAKGAARPRESCKAKRELQVL